MPGYLAHIAINADDDGATQRFYEAVFDWTFAAWGPPGFVRTPLPSGGEVAAAVQARRELVDGVRTNAPEVTIGVDDIAAAERLVVEHGGAIVMQPSTIPTVGTLLFATDPSGNFVGIIQFE